MSSWERLGVVVAVVVPWFSAGCGSRPQTPEKNEPSYAELVLIYNAELESLDRLERKRSDLIAEYEAKHRPDSQQQAVQSLTDLVAAAGEFRKDGRSELPIDPNIALDQAVRNAEQAHEMASRLFQSAAQAAAAQQQNAGGQTLAYSEEFQQQLAALDADIEAQRSRVERARQARDTAEAKK